MVRFRMSFVVSRAMRIRPKECNVVDARDVVSTDGCILQTGATIDLASGFFLSLDQHQLFF